MNVNSTKFKELVALVATEWTNCEPELEMVRICEDPPEIATVYILTNRAGEIQYIGHSKQLDIRLAQHMSNARMLKKIRWDKTFFFYPGIKSVGKRLQVEGILGIAAVPKGNTAFMLRRNKQNLWSEIRYRSRR